MEKIVHRRHHQTNIPTEIIRTLSVIAETGSFSKAGEKLGLSQPAISAQVKRLQTLVGGAVFDRVAGGVSLTPRGQTVLAYARKILEANDQILSLGGATREAPNLRLGISTYFATEFMQIWKDAGIAIPASFYCDHSSELAKGVVEGYLDVAMLLNPPHEAQLAANWEEEFVWARSRDLLVSPGAPVPIITWPGNIFDSVAIRTLESAGLSYRVVFASPDGEARTAAAQIGLGFIGMPVRKVEPPLIVANDYYLPAPGVLRAGIAVRDGIRIDSVRLVVDLFKRLIPSEMAQNPVRREAAHG
jgi:DNA-binding transcriptional LysR family regulator